MSRSRRCTPDVPMRMASSRLSLMARWRRARHTWPATISCLAQRVSSTQSMCSHLSSGIITNGQSQPPVLERFVFELGLSLGASGTDRAELRGQLRGFLVKLNFCDSLLSPLPPDGLEFGVEVHTHQAAASAEPTSEELRELWVECDLQSEVGRPTSPQVVPLKSVSSPELSMQLFVMEAASKGG